MRTLVVVNRPADWPLNIAGVEVVSARGYLTDPTFVSARNLLVFNLCRSYRYQSSGYYVSLLAAARGHRILPSISTVQNMKSAPIVRNASEELDELIQKSLHPLQTDEFILSVYFGRNVAKRYDRLSRQLFNLFRTPLLQASFKREEGHWALLRIGPIGAREIPASHHDCVIEAAQEYFSKPRYTSLRRRSGRYDLAILQDPNEELPPSDATALKRFVRAARHVGLEPELITRDDYGRLAEFDGLFIRETTAVNHHTYRFAQRAHADGLVVIDDPLSILRCTNKVYLAELLARHHIPTPSTIVLHRDNLDSIVEEIGLPCILKQPDSSFSQGVVKIETPEELKAAASRLFEKSDLLIAQQFMPTPFDWRVGVLDGRALYVCRYHMARQHWQILKSGPSGRTIEGKVETLGVEEAPPKVVRTALKAARLIGDGLYGVDLKQVGNQVYIIEVNDNPSLDAGYEDTVLKDELYRQIMQVFLERIEALKKDNQQS